MNLTAQQTATVLAALRYWQRDLEDNMGLEHDVPEGIIDGAGHFETEKPLNSEQIDELCERINFADEEIEAGLPRRLGEWFPTSYLCREDVEMRGYDPAKLDNADMREMARMIHQSCMDTETYWIAIDTYCDYHNIPKLKKEENHA